MRPLGTRVLLRRPPVSDQIGSIIIPDKYRMIPQEGVVVAVGSEVQSVKVGETVLHGRFARMGLPQEYGEDLYLVWERDLMAVLDCVS